MIRDDWFSLSGVTLMAIRAQRLARIICIEESKRNAEL